MRLELKNAEMNRIISHETERIIGVTGKRTAYCLKYTETTIEIMHHYLDEEVDENFTCLEFFNTEKSICLAVAGLVGIIKIIDISVCKFIGYLKGHGGAITEITTLERGEDMIMFSSSEDTTIRMWDIKRLRCVGIFGGYVGHRDYVLSIDVSICGKKLVSSSSDCTIKVWDVPEIDTKALNPVYFPRFSSSKVHKSYIGCCKFYGELIISKSLSNRLSIVLPEYNSTIYNTSTSSDCFFIDEFKAESHLGLIYKFSLDHNLLALSGAENSEDLYIFDLRQLGTGFIPKIYKVGKSGIKDLFLKGLLVFILYLDSSIQVFKLPS